MNNYLVAVFVDHSKKNYTITARPENHVHLPLMIEDAVAENREYNVLAKGLDKGTADAMKTVMIATYLTAGYARVGWGETGRPGK